VKQKTYKLLFSIVVPTRNRDKLLSECLVSIQKQSFSNFECIIVDDGSTDQTKSEVEKISDARFIYFYQEHKERSSARNKGIALAKGNYIIFIDDDDLLKPQYLETFAKHINSPDYKGEILRVGYQTKPINQKRAPFYQTKKHGHPLRFAAYNMVGVWTLCIPKAYLNEIQFPTAFPHWQDTYLILRLLKQYALKQISKRLYIYRLHNEMGSRLVENEVQLEQRAIDNVTAIKDFEHNHLNEVKPHLNESDFKFLYAEKFAQYAVLAKQEGFKKLSKSLMRRAHDHKISIRLIKYYVRNL